MSERDANIPRTLLVSGTSPAASGVGELFLRDLCSNLPADRLALAVTTEPHPETAELFPEVKACWVPVRIPQGPVSGGRIKRWRSARRSVRHCRRVDDPRVIDAFVRHGAEHEAETVWAVLDTPQMSRVAPEVSRRLGVPLRCTIWDPPEGITRTLRLDRFSRAEAVNEFATCLRASTKCAVISERMGEEYTRRFGIDAVVLRHGVNTNRCSDELVLREDANEEFVIGFCGSIYAESEWKTLLAALDELRWTIGERPVRLKVAGSHVPFLRAATPARFEYLGWRPMSEVLSVMAGCDLCYLPYWFNPHFAESVRLCFATKLTTYLSVRRPVLYHGPSDAALVDFFERFPAAFRCHSPDATDLAAVLGAAGDDERRRICRAAAERAVADELNADVFHARFREFLGAPDVEPARVSSPGPVTEREAIS